MAAPCDTTQNIRCLGHDDRRSTQRNSKAEKASLIFASGPHTTHVTHILQPSNPYSNSEDCRSFGRTRETACGASIPQRLRNGSTVAGPFPALCDHWSVTFLFVFSLVWTNSKRMTLCYRNRCTVSEISGMQNPKR